ncbi:hypothetical protein J6590_007548 [Homalodisca vitripennis]|nr:hypothetical protein J6590_007548 [Homalodisca vitripennis]
MVSSGAIYMYLPSAVNVLIGETRVSWTMILLQTCWNRLAEDIHLGVTATRALSHLRMVLAVLCAQLKVNDVSKKYFLSFSSINMINILVVWYYPLQTLR